MSESFAIDPDGRGEELGGVGGGETILRNQSRKP